MSASIVENAKKLNAEVKVELSNTDELVSKLRKQKDEVEENLKKAHSRISQLNHIENVLTTKTRMLTDKLTEVEDAKEGTKKRQKIDEQIEKYTNNLTTEIEEVKTKLKNLK